MRRAARALAALLALGQAAAAEPAAIEIAVEGPAEILFDVAKNVCGAFAMPDVNARAFRDAGGGTVMFALEQENRPFAGPSLSAVQPTCRSALSSGENADPAAFDGRRYIAATWTVDGRAVAALVHDEYHAETHPGRCVSTEGLACWWNAIVAARSDDGGLTFAPASPLVVAAAPFRQDIDQTRHRGFFNPSNMVAGPGGVYAFASTTGWAGQSGGACLLRNADPFDAAGWRGFDGAGWTARWTNPYAGKPFASPCQPVRPFGYPVAVVVRHRPSGLWLAMWEQPKIDGATQNGVFPVAGFYIATSRDLLRWSDATLFLPTPIVHQPCGLHEENRDGVIFAYPSLLDETAEGRNYDNVGAGAWLYYARIAMDGCNPGARRMLVRQRVTFTPREP